MADDITLREYAKTIESAATNEEQQILYIRGLVKLFPISNVYLFRFSPIGFQTEGVIYLDELGKVHTIHNVRDDLRSLPIIEAAVRNRQADLITTESYITHSDSPTVPKLASALLIAPICLSANVVGYTISTAFQNEKLEKIHRFLPTITIYGKMFGKILESNFLYPDVMPLSKREIEVMQRLAHGNSIKEISASLDLSEHTVKDYVKSAVKKTNGMNRLHATIILMRKGIII